MNKETPQLNKIRHLKCVMQRIGRNLCCFFSKFIKLKPKRYIVPHPLFINIMLYCGLPIFCKLCFRRTLHYA